MPPITFDGAVIQVDAVQMTTLDVEQRVTEPVEQVLLGMDGVESFHSTSTLGNSSLTIEIEEGRGRKFQRKSISFACFKTSACWSSRYNGYSLFNERNV
ncbi:hypothetical protein JCM9140_1472 [Halalkalibacter wakoensis JCM 9140]|uniref:Uncharacterized protein n=1 Tax=Halalkalibacter wakoensis JCM 9140 TaxID=1236970 RepID=W4Q294_9BACI|nr:efflux RND transporter permease subunit [Halalkalibacter wakoensis]GAE25474.1 hypothetical protein JCM9140_1472 [Halalkalibacter wakoensis JCM 9140]